MHKDPVSDVVDFTGRFLEDAARGEPDTLENYVRRYPDHREEIEHAYAELLAELDSAERKAPAYSSTPSDIGPYRIQERLGTGGQGIVYLAVDSRLNRRVALKVLHPAIVGSHSARERFRREAEVISKLDDPGLCSVYEANLEDDVPYLAMRYLEGETLAHRIGHARGTRRQASSDSTTCLPRGRRALEATLEAFEQLARSLHVAHEAGVIHRDIKPGNVIETTEGRLVLCDFGLARDSAPDSDTLTRTGDTFGTPGYMSPEQLIEGGMIDRRTDVYSLGVTLYECLTLKRPFRGGGLEEQRNSILTDRLPDPARSNPDVPRELTTVLETAVEKDANRRYPTATEFADELARIRHREPVLARRPSFTYHVTKFVERNRRATAVLAALLILLGAAVYGLLRARSTQQDLERRSAAENRALAVEAALAGDAVEARRRLQTSAGMVEGWESRLVRHALGRGQLRSESGPANIDRVRVSVDGNRVVVSAEGSLHTASFDEGHWRKLPTPRPLNYLSRWELSRDGNLVALTLGEDELWILSTLDDLEVTKLPLEWQPARTAFGPDNSTLAVSSHFEKKIRLLDLSTREVTGSFEVSGAGSLLRYTDNGATLYGVSPSAMWMRVGTAKAVELAQLDVTGSCSLSDNGSALLLDGAGRYELMDPAGNLVVARNAPVWEIEADPGGSVTVAGAGRALQVRDVRTGQLLAALAGHEGNIRALTFDGAERLLSADDAGQLRYWKLDEDLPVARTSLPRVDVAGLSEHHVVTVNRGTHILWDARSSTELFSGLGAPAQGVRAVALDREGAHFALAGMHARSSVIDRQNRYVVSLVNAASGSYAWTSVIPGPPIALAVFAKPIRVAVGLETGGLVVLDGNGLPLWSQGSATSSTNALAWSPDGKLLTGVLAEPGGKTTLACWGGPDGGLVWSRSVEELRALTFHASEPILVTGSSSGGIEILAGESGETLVNIEEVGAQVEALALHPTEPRLAALVGSRLLIWDVANSGESPLLVTNQELEIGKGQSLAFREGGATLTAVGLRGFVTFETRAPETRLARERETARRQRSRALHLLKEFPALHEVEERTDAATALRAAFHENADELNRRAWTVTTRDNQDIATCRRALGWCRRAVEIAPERARYWNTLGLLHLQLEDFEAAIAAFERAEALNLADSEDSVRSVEGATPFNLYPLAEAHARLGRGEPAQEAFDHAERILESFWSRRELKPLRESARLALEALAGSPR